MEKKRNITGIVMWTFAVLLFLTLLSMYLVSNMYARYTTEVSSEDGARVAAYVFRLEDASDSQVVNLKNIKKPGDTQEYKFSVTNKRDNVISEVAQSYTIKLEVEGSMPIVCEIKEQGDTEQKSDSTICKAGNTNEINTNSGSSDAIKLLAAEEYTKSYTLTAVWPDTYKDEKYASASGTSVVTLTVDAQQLD